MAKFDVLGKCLRHALLHAWPVLLIVPAAYVLGENPGDPTPQVTKSPLLRASVPVDDVSADSVARDLVLSNENLDKQEAELKRMEAELLSKLNTPGASITTETPKGASVTKVKIAPVEAPLDLPAPPKSAKIQLSPLKEVAAATKNSGTSNKSAAALLRELEDHPAIVGNAHRVAPVRVSDLDVEPSATSEWAQKLAVAESQVKILSRELETTRRSLNSAEQRIDELTTLVKNSRSDRAEIEDSLSARGSLRSDTKTVEPYQDEAPRGHFVPIAQGGDVFPTGTANSRSSDVATIAVDKAPLRIAPGRLESALFLLPRRSQVQIEHRSGEWYRVVTAGGVRGWIFGGSVRFDAGVSEESAVRIGGTRNGYEPTGIKY